MKKTLSLSEIAVGIFVFILVATFALQFATNRRAGGKVLAQSVQLQQTWRCDIDGLDHTYEPQCVVEGAIVSRGDGRQYKCLRTCLYEPIGDSGPTISETPGCCEGNARTGVMRFNKNRSQEDCSAATSEQLASMTAGQEITLKWFGSQNAYDSAVMSHGGSCVARPAPVCGNTLVEEPKEQCEPTVPCKNGSECVDCKCKISISCGNAKKEGTEECDRGVSNSDQSNAECRMDCKSRRCGDGIKDDLFGEECDLGAQNGVEGVLCSSLCKIPQQIIEPVIEPSQVYFVTTPYVQLANPLYVMKTVMQWNLMTVLAPFVNLQNFLFPQDMMNQVLGQ